MNKLFGKELEIYRQAQDDWQAEELKQIKKDIYTLNHVKNSVSDTDFKHIEAELEDSEHHINYKIINAPVGEPQFNEKFHYTIWVNQSCGETGDNYSGTVCMKISDDEYFIWDYWM